MREIGELCRSLEEHEELQREVRAKLRKRVMRARQLHRYQESFLKYLGKKQDRKVDVPVFLHLLRGFLVNQQSIKSIIRFPLYNAHIASSFPTKLRVLNYRLARHKPHELRATLDPEDFQALREVVDTARNRGVKIEV